MESGTCTNLTRFFFSFLLSGSDVMMSTFIDPDLKRITILNAIFYGSNGRLPVFCVDCLLAYSMDPQDYLLAAIFLRGMSNGGVNDTL
jgi:hypothetical protein